MKPDSIGDGATSTRRQRKRHKGLTLGVAAAVALAIGGGGAWAATSYLGTDAADPQSHLPASTAAFATMNLGVSHDQQDKILNLITKFPAAGVDSDSPQKAITEFLKTVEQHNGDVETGKFSDWVGPNASMALWEHGGEPYGLATVAVTDADAADNGLAALENAGGSDQVGYQIKDGCATIAFGEKGAQAAAKAAVAEADKSPLSGSKKYAKAKHFLGKDQVVTGWADLDHTYKIIEEKAPQDDGHLPFDFLKALKNAMHGQFAFGAKAQDWGIEGVSSTFGAKDVVEGKPGLVDKMSQLPESEIAGAVAMPDDVKGTVIKALVDSGLGGIAQGVDNVVLDKVFDMMSGSKTAFSLNGVTTKTPSGMASIETTSPDKARILKTMADLTGGALQTTVDGNTITGHTANYTGDGKITDNPYYKTAMAGATKKLNGAGFFDVQKLLPEEAKQPLAAMKAVGVTWGTKGGEYVGNYRAIIA